MINVFLHILVVWNIFYYIYSSITCFDEWTENENIDIPRFGFAILYDAHHIGKRNDLIFKNELFIEYANLKELTESTL